MLAGAASVLAGAFALFVIFEVIYRVRERASRTAAHVPVEADAVDYERARAAIRYRIGLLLQPKEGKAVIGGDHRGPLIEAGLLYGRLALLEERRGNVAASRSCMSKGVALLEEAHHPDPSESHIREMVARQDATLAK
jgi:hypothetical protein